jgi:hypothetical protein
VPHVRRLLPLVLAIAIVAAGCGGGSGAQSHRFAQSAKTICARVHKAIGPLRPTRSWGRHAAAELATARAQLGALQEPPNTHRAIARLELHWRRLEQILRASGPTAKEYRPERYQAVLSAHLLNVKTCMSVLPKT